MKRRLLCLLGLHFYVEFVQQQFCWSCGKRPEMGAFNVFAYTRGDDDYTGDVRRQAVPRRDITAALVWALDQGHDTVLIERAPSPAPVRALPVSHSCNDPACPGGC